MALLHISMRKLTVVLLGFFLNSLALSYGNANDLELKLLSSATYDNIEWKNLLHYSGSKSVIDSDSNFFLSPNGYKEPQAEYLATVKALFAKENKDDNSILCRYPARVRYILEANGSGIKEIAPQKCTAYQEYLQKVPMDTVYIVFAAESNNSPSSIMGHIFLKIAGQYNNSQKEHSFSYFAAIDNSDSLKFYLDVVSIGLEGSYLLSPYRTTKNEYLYGEKRALWTFGLSLTDEEKERLKAHLWELKDKNIRYKFVSHNCNTAIENVLKVANSNFAGENFKPFSTPIEYIQQLQEEGKIKEIILEPTDYMKEKLQKNSLKTILAANKSSRIDIGYRKQKHNYMDLSISPIYQDIRDINNAYYDEIESKMANISLAYNADKKRVFLQGIDILKMRSIIDYAIQQEHSKHFKISFENSLGEDTTNLKPTIEIGLGYGYYKANLVAYFLPKIGYRYNKYSNIYLSPEIGIIAQLNNKIKIISSYDVYFNSYKNNRGYNSKYNLYIGYNLIKNTNIYFNYSHYTDNKYNNSLSFGISRNF